jgi:shikimate dehydrogenase
MSKQELREVYSISDLRAWSKIAGAITPPIRLAVVGDPVAHSLSPQLQNAALGECGVDMQYTRLQVPPNELEEALGLLRKNEFVGANLTLPHKEQALRWLDQIDAQAQEVGAVNTIVVRDEKLIGFNTDGVGFARAIREGFSVDLRDLRVLLLGAGGAGQAIAFECARENCERLVVANRTRSKAEQLVQKLQPFFAGPRVLGPVARLQALGCTESDFRAQIPHTDLIVNATPLGLRPLDPPPIEARLLEPHLMIFDTVYGPGSTPFVTAAKEAGARPIDGRSMLLHQGARAFELWFGREAPLGVMRTTLDQALSR